MHVSRLAGVAVTSRPADAFNATHRRGLTRQKQARHPHLTPAYLLPQRGGIDAQLSAWASWDDLETTMQIDPHVRALSLSPSHLDDDARAVVTLGRGALGTNALAEAIMRANAVAHFMMLVGG